MTEVGIRVRILRNTEKFKGATERFILTCQNNKLSKILKTISTHTKIRCFFFDPKKYLINKKKLCIYHKTVKCDDQGMFVNKTDPIFSEKM
jgi:hypothetical protein